LVSAEDYDAIFAWGMEITHRDECEAVIYRRDPTTRYATHGVHESAESARVLYSRLIGMPLALVYMDFADEVERLYAMFDTEPALTS
jgi:hypothetical protein